MSANRVRRSLEYALVDTLSSTPHELAKLLKSESLQYGKIIRAVGIKGE